MICRVVFFFFSSRRRHTRLVSDWSSDVCSSDLAQQRTTLDIYVTDVEGGNATLFVTPAGESVLIDTGNLVGAQRDAGRIMDAARDRSEERRVGKECGGRWGGDQLKEEEDGDRRR